MPPIKKPHPLFLSLLSGLLLSISWIKPFTCFIFIAWIPLLMLEEHYASSTPLRRRRLKLTGYSYLAFFTWNICVTWWVVYASLGGAAMAFICNSLLMCMVFMIWHNIKKRIHKPWTIWLLVPLWLAWEYGHTLWDLTWTWLTLGNAFAFEHHWIQWYEFTGVSGGSLWVLVVNILLYKSLTHAEGFAWKKLVPAGLAIALPIAISLLIPVLEKGESSARPQNVVVVQPNIDPYNDKFNTEPAAQLANLLRQLDGKLSAETDYLVLPETYLTEYVNEAQLENSYSIRFLRSTILKEFPQIKIVTGASTYRFFGAGEEVSSTARQSGDDNRFYDSYNTALQIDSTPVIQIYHKSKLVPGVERMPFPWLLKPFEKLAIDMGGTMGSLGTQPDRVAFFNAAKNTGIAPVICYESVYGNYMTGYMRQGANMIFIITNDGWWEDTPGYKQHLAYARLRAIESRCPIARSANTGISCFITPQGDIGQATNWWKPAVIQASLRPNPSPTFYSRFGDLISLGAVALAFLAIGYALILRFKKA